MRKRQNVARKLIVAGGCALVIFIVWRVVDPRVGRLWWNTLCLSGASCLVALPLGTLVALGIAKTDLPGRRIGAWSIIAMLFVPLFLIAGAWDAGFGMQGWHTLATNPRLAHEPWIAGWRGAVWVHAMAAVPWVALVVGASLRAVEPEIEEDAALCAPPWRVILHVTIPRIAPALVVAALLVAIATTTEISVTDLYQVRTFAEEVYTQSALGTFDFNPEGINNWPSAPLGAAGMWLGLLFSAALAVALLIAARGLLADLADDSQRRPWRWRLGQRRFLAAIGLWSILFLVAGMPLISLLQKAGVEVTATDTGRIRRWSGAKLLERARAAPFEHRGEILQSAQIGIAAATAALVIAAPLAWSLRTARRIPILRLAALALCLTIPGPVLGVALIRVLNQPPDSPLAFIAPLYDSRFAPWLAQTIRALPVATLIVWASLSTIPQSIFDAAATDRAGWWSRFLRIALPQRWPAVTAAWLIALAVSVGELAATILVMPPARHTVISVRVFQLLHYGVDDRVAAISLVLAFGIASLTAIAAGLARRTKS